MKRKALLFSFVLSLTASAQSHKKEEGSFNSVFPKRTAPASAVDAKRAKEFEESFAPLTGTLKGLVTEIHLHHKNGTVDTRDITRKEVTLSFEEWKDLSRIQRNEAESVDLEQGGDLVMIFASGSRLILKDWTANKNNKDRSALYGGANNAPKAISFPNSISGSDAGAATAFAK